MPGRIVIVHDDCDFLEATTGVLRAAGYEVVAFADTMSAYIALKDATKVELLIIRIEYPQGQPHGIALARMARSRRPEVKLIFAARPEHRSRAKGLGDFIAMPTTPEDILGMVGRVLDNKS